jgi:enediyne polyketide synthase
MGARLGRTRLLQQGITPISPQQGVAILRDLLVQSLPLVSVVVMSRFRDLQTFKIERPELPFLRFLEEPRSYYPAVELIFDVNLSADSDPYLNDHKFQGESLLPAVMGLEAMTQAAMALSGAGALPVFEDVRFNQSVIVPATKSSTVRIVALRQGSNYVDVALRTEETAYQVNHFQVRCKFAKAKSIGNDSCFDESATSERVSLDPERDLYGDLLFHTGRFRRLANYRLLKAKQCIAEISPDTRGSWFSQYFPSTLVLGDPGARDAAIHAIQACIPHVTLLPTGIERLTIAQTTFAGPLVVHARERSAEGDTFVYDLIVTDDEGNIHERWDGLRLKAVSHRSTKVSWITSLLAPYLERRVHELLPASELSVTLVQDAERDREKRSAVAFQALLGAEGVVLKRPDGKPEVPNGSDVSVAHHDNLTLAVSGPAHIGCDLEKAVYRPPSIWRALIGDEGMALVQLLQSRVNESHEVSATRLWSAKECLKKAGAMNAPLVFVSASDDGWVILSSGLSTIATYSAQFRSHEGTFVIAILASASQTNVQLENRVMRKVRDATL